jgi:hypothetical protein
MVLLPKVSSLAKLRGLQWKHDLKPMAYTTEVLVTLTKIERRCDFGVCLPGHVVYSCSNNIVNFFFALRRPCDCSSLRRLHHHT